MAGVQSIDRAFAILRALAAGPAGVSDLATRVDLPRSTVARLLAALEAQGAVAQYETGGSYRLGPAMADLAGSAAPGGHLISAARPHLVNLAQSTNETAGLSVLEGRTVFYLDQVAADHDVQVRDWTGERAPLHAVPSGLVILAGATPSALDAYLDGPLEQFTPKTVVDPRQIRARLAAIHGRGYEWVYEEFAEGINSVAAAIDEPDGQVRAALHVHGPSYRFPASGDDARIGELVADAAARLTAQRCG